MVFKTKGSGAVNAFGKVKSTAFGETVYGGLNIYRIIVNTVAYCAEIFYIYGACFFIGSECYCAVTCCFESIFGIGGEIEKRKYVYS